MQLFSDEIDKNYKSPSGVISYFFLKQILFDNDGKKIIKDRFLALYPEGIKLCSDTKDAFDPKYLFKMLDTEPMFYYVNIKSFRFDPDEGDFIFIYKPVDEQDSIENEFRFKIARVQELKEVIRDSIKNLQERKAQQNEQDLIQFE